MSLAYFPLYPDDFEADTAHLTLAEDGAYNRLLRLCWRTPGCSLPADRAWIHRRMRAHTEADKAVVDTVLDEFFALRDGRVSNARLAKEWRIANESHKRRVEAGAKGGKAKALKDGHSAPSNAEAKPKQPEPEPEPYTEEANASSVGARKRGTRLPADWALPDDWRDWAVSQHGMTAASASFEAEKFRDHWQAKAGRDAAKLDWAATWRNWCRNATARRPTQAANVSQFPRIRAKLPEGWT
jgi:uncharacterized protein YdaU (DUF1376 family)